MEKEYIPFNSRDDFFAGYSSYLLCPKVSPPFEVHFLLGDWLKEISTDDYKLITGIGERGLWICGDFISYENILERYCFLDDTPCGKEIEKA